MSYVVHTTVILYMYVLIVLTDLIGYTYMRTIIVYNNITCLTLIESYMYITFLLYKFKLITCLRAKDSACDFSVHIIIYCTSVCVYNWPAG